MKLRITSSLFLLALTTQAFAVPAPTPITPPGSFYFGVFGGGGASNDFDVSQFGTAFYTEAEGGPLAVNAFGMLEGQSAGFWGAQLGYQAPGIFVDPHVTIGPAAELEALFLSNTTFTGDLMNNTDRLPEHDFAVSFPMSRSIFLVNGVINFTNVRYPVHPYVGLGIGEAVIRISNATGTQVAPPEVGVNHYNASTNDTISTFAGQIKVGLVYDVWKNISVFADYRWIYLASTEFTFGSTVYAAHVVTSPWLVKMDTQRNNMGNVGIRVNF